MVTTILFPSRTRSTNERVQACSSNITLFSTLFGFGGKYAWRSSVPVQDHTSDSILDSSLWPYYSPYFSPDRWTRNSNFHLYQYQSRNESVLLQTHDIVVGPQSPEDHVTQKYTNTIIGRYANRIPVGTHVIERHGIKNEFTAVANGGLPTSLVVSVLCLAIARESTSLASWGSKRV